jgi:predicted small integral membrane protein
MLRLVVVIAFGAFSSPALAQNSGAEGVAFLSWMAWTWQTALFFAVIAAMLVVMTVWEIVKPGGDPREPGILGIDTTRGDRLFIALLSAAYIHLAWLALFSGPLWWASVIAIVWAAAVAKWA